MRFVQWKQLFGIFLQYGCLNSKRVLFVHMRLIVVLLQYSPDKHLQTTIIQGREHRKKNPATYYVQHSYTVFSYFLLPTSTCFLTVAVFGVL